MTKKTSKLAKQAKPPKRSGAAKPANKVAPVKKSKPAKTYILFGTDEYAKPRAARFSAEDPELLAAADAMHLRLVEVTNPDVAEVARRLPAGRLHASGQGLVPYVKGPLYLEWSQPCFPTRISRRVRSPQPRNYRVAGTKSDQIIS
jgi:hypothetical protein